MTENTGKKLEKPGIFKKGDDPRRNMNGRPVGSLSFATALREEAEKQSGIVTLADGTQKRVTALELITRKLVELGKNGDMQAIKEIADRMDGKARQAVDLDVQGNMNISSIDSETQAELLALLK